jgi:hypothetical protein
MFAAKRVGLMGAMPPEKITARLLDRLGWQRRSREAQDVAASLAHLGFGAAGGSLFALLERGLRPPGPPVVAGTLFAAGVWLVSYMGWVPALGILPPAHRDRPGRPQSMLAAHLVYGAALGFLIGSGSPRRKRAKRRRRPRSASV